MGWILSLFAMAISVFTGVREEKRAGLWMDSKFLFALGFAAVEVVLVVLPVAFMDWNGRFFVPVISVGGVLAVANFVWMILIMRRWKLPDGRTSLEAARDDQARR